MVMENLKIFCVTWNVKTTWPECDFDKLLEIKQSDPADHLPDIYVISFQEVKSQPQNVIMDTLFEEPWTASIRSLLGPLGYVRLTGQRLQGLLTSVFIRMKHIIHVRDIHTSVQRTGFGGFWGNKGAIAVRFSIYGCSFCFVNCHLAPHDSGYEERCNHYNSIIDDIQFPVQPTIKILYHDYVFMLGDLNFRLLGNDSSEKIVNSILSGDLHTLEEKDELRKAQKSEDAFGPLTEGELCFPPTYKYLLHSSNYELSRRPAWTDRILYQVHVDAYENIKLNVQLNKYTSIQSYCQSDHKPVIANFTVKVFANYEEKMVHFKSIKEWLIGGLNKVTYILDSDVSPSPWDYITMFKENFTSTNEYVTYAYVLQLNFPLNDETGTRVPSTSKQRSFQLLFNDEMVQTPGEYRILYYSETYKSYLGMSNAFEVKFKN